MKIIWTIAVLAIVVCAVLFFQPGGFLVINNAEKADAIVVLGGDAADARYWRGLQLLREGYARHLFLDANTGMTYGHSYVDLAKDFVAKTAGRSAAQVSVCPIEGDSTKIESFQVDQCLRQMQPPPQSVIIATDDYHTRRALSIFQHELPQYRWTAAAAYNGFLFGQPWWKHREWAKTYLMEWQKLLWWEVVDRWHIGRR